MIGEVYNILLVGLQVLQDGVVTLFFIHEWEDEVVVECLEVIILLLFDFGNAVVEDAVVSLEGV